MLTGFIFLTFNHWFFYSISILSSYFIIFIIIIVNSIIVFFSYGGETMTAQIPFPSPPDFGVEANDFMYRPTTCTLIETGKGQTGSIHFWTVH